MAEATLPNLIAAGLIKAPSELERSYKGDEVLDKLREFFQHRAIAGQR